MQPRGPKTLYRISWSGGKYPQAEGSKYYVDEVFLRKWLERLTSEGAKIQLEKTTCNWEIMAEL